MLVLVINRFPPNKLVPSPRLKLPLELIYPSAAIFPEVSIEALWTPAAFMSTLVPDNNALELIAPSADVTPEASTWNTTAPSSCNCNACPIIVELALIAPALVMLNLLSPLLVMFNELASIAALELIAPNA